MLSDHTNTCKTCGIPFTARKNRIKSAKFCSRQCVRTMKPTHGMSGTRLYKVWDSMWYRCTTDGKNGNGYKDRGVTVFNGWKKFELFRDWALATGYQDDLEIDRIDNDKGYYPANCRWATRTQQLRNRRKQNGTSSKYKGVYWNKARQKWLVQIRYGGKKHSIGYFNVEEDAARAYDTQALIHHGEYTVLNFKKGI